MSARNLNTSLQSQELYLDSQYASVNSSADGFNSDVTFFIQSPVRVGNDYNIVLRLENIVVPISFYLINQSNNTLVVNSTTYTIPQGNYNVISLRSALQTLLSEFTVTYSEVTNKFTFSSASNFTFNSTSTCFKILGFKEGQNHTSTANTLTAPYCVNLAGTGLIYVDVTNITTRNISARNGGAFTSIVKSIPINTTIGSVMTYVNNTNSAVILGEKYITYLRVRLLDDDYNLLNLNGQHFTLTFELFFYPNGDELFSGSLNKITSPDYKDEQTEVQPLY